MAETYGKHAAGARVCEGCGDPLAAPAVRVIRKVDVPASVNPCGYVDFGVMLIFHEACVPHGPLYRRVDERAEGRTGTSPAATEGRYSSGSLESRPGATVRPERAQVG